MKDNKRQIVSITKLAATAALEEDDPRVAAFQIGRLWELLRQIGWVEEYYDDGNIDGWEGIE